MKRLYRSKHDRMFSGVLGGIAAYLNMDPTIARLLFVVGMFFSAGTLMLLYIVAIFIIPNEWDILE